MKYYLFIAIFLFSPHSLFGQKTLDEAYLKCQYKLSYTKDTLSFQNTSNDLLILQIGKTITKCYSYYSNQVDSILAMSNSHDIMREHLNNAFSKKEINTNDYPHKRMKTYIYKNYPQGKMTVTDGLALQDYIYEDELNSQNWQILDSIKVILNYPCQKAECSFRGRRWAAWFAADIAVSDGPWKFGGLPGLIMEIYDQRQQYYFTIIGLQKVEAEPIIFSQAYVGSKKFEKTNRKEFLKAQKRYLMDINGDIELETGIGLGGNNLQKVIQYDLIELDYK